MDHLSTKIPFEKYEHLNENVKSEITKSKKLNHIKLMSKSVPALWTSIKQNLAN